ncbi:MAG TPA: TatD family hydrolase [Chloroflexota bacterium]|nr:TatD family hydrolase [Chloroflexota bacterium]
MGAAPARVPPLVDTHAHLTDRKFAADLDAVFDRARGAGVVAFVVVGYDLASSEESVELAGRRDDVWAAVGIHPHNARLADRHALRRVADLSRAPRVVAIGECGLDYYRNLSPRHVQRQAFEAQLGLASECGLPVIVHSREAMPETLEILARCAPPKGGVMHCFDGTADDATRAVQLGLYVSVSGPITFRKDNTLAGAVAAVPADRVLVETDCPYLSPDGHRGERNEPAHVRLVAEAVARARSVRFEETACQTSANAQRLFSIRL